MPSPVFKDDTIDEGALAIGQTLRLGGFLMTACSAAAPMMTSRVIENNLHVKSALTEQMDPMELASLNELLDRIAALGVAADHQEGPNLGKNIVSLVSCYHPPRRTVRDPLPEICQF